jgi:hypothetical protein
VGRTLPDEYLASQMPENLMSRNTLKNVEKNKERIDYCVTTFSYISNRYHRCAPGVMRKAVF